MDQNMDNNVSNQDETEIQPLNQADNVEDKEQDVDGDVEDKEQDVDGDVQHQPSGVKLNQVQRCESS